jgi:hypothetical protein
MPTTLLALIAPQRSTQYAALAEALAPHELALGAAGALLDGHAPERVRLGGQTYLRFDVGESLSEADLRALAGLATMTAYAEVFDELGGQTGPFLRPIELPDVTVWSLELVEARRYRGKTNELFTRFLCNIARQASAFAAEPWPALRVLDPLAGGGTTLFTALTLGASAFGIEKTTDDVSQTAGYMRQFCNESKRSFTEKEERLKGVGRRFAFSFPESQQQLVYAAGDTANTVKLLNGCKKAHLVVTDLPYGIQHQGQLVTLLRAGLPAWRAMCEPGGALTFSWDATRFPREDMLATLAAHPEWRPAENSAYANLAHPVDRVIKRRDGIVAIAV